MFHANLWLLIIVISLKCWCSSSTQRLIIILTMKEEPHHFCYLKDYFTQTSQNNEEVSKENGKNHFGKISQFLSILTPKEFVFLSNQTMTKKKSFQMWRCVLLSSCPPVPQPGISAELTLWIRVYHASSSPHPVTQAPSSLRFSLEHKTECGINSGFGGKWSMKVTELNFCWRETDWNILFKNQNILFLFCFSSRFWFCERVCYLQRIINQFVSVWRRTGNAEGFHIHKNRNQLKVEMFLLVCFCFILTTHTHTHTLQAVSSGPFLFIQE